ncbi:pyridoxal phosphate-dependent aminotransferase [Moheibacter lacus]|uniref:Aminotransferase class I/II-fold pyridoxal phosphate-dependent enzyme n=1 Tax=Moheibacter lacus TaxID=2745851 RepID=A0A838ZQM6_9FLAO|nr:aminotransferase class I/II-fold pyridoxal phosphate-dependent enzyme [Moheibacter lacus]MBA5628282.1 aminotransferase class I/II-fold pyridoxal phosphate-dependent enzyme [Moheibacter lacus]
MKTSQLSENLKGSAIIKLAGEVKALQAQGEKIYNLTIGDFDSKIFPIPDRLKSLIIEAYEKDLTNYPLGNGEIQLRKSVSDYLKKNLGLTYSENEILISGGARPLIYAVYQTILDLEDTVLYPTPSWNNDAYTYLARNKEIVIETSPENKFMPTAAEIEPYMQEVDLIAVCSPLNPTGTTFEKEELAKISDLIVAENKRRKELDLKPLYLLYDQIYWQLTYGETEHYNPVSLNPEMRDYTIFIDGISKAFAATGVRVGWAFGPEKIIHKMKDILGHIGAWAPKPEQLATAEFLTKENEVASYLTQIKSELSFRLDEFYKGFAEMKSEGFPVDVIEPEAALYLTVKFDLIGKMTESGNKIETVQEITSYLLKEAKVALVPFSAFGASIDSTWFRLSVGTTSKSDISEILSNLKKALENLY